MSKDIRMTQAIENCVLESIYNNVTKSRNHGQWVHSIQYDSVVLRDMWERGLVELNGGFVTLTEKRMGVLLFGEDDAEEILKFVSDGEVC